MSYEINIISVGQKNVSLDCQLAEIVIRNEVTSKDLGRYYKIWPIFSHTEGILYVLEKEMSDGFFSSFPLCDSDFETHIDPELLPSFIPSETWYNLTPLIIYPQYYPDVETAIRMLLQDSPCKTILFLARYEGGDDELYYGALPINLFLQQIREHKILFNVCYIVTADLIP